MSASLGRIRRTCLRVRRHPKSVRPRKRRHLAAGLVLLSFGGAQLAGISAAFAHFSTENVRWNQNLDGTYCGPLAPPLPPGYVASVAECDVAVRDTSAVTSQGGWQYAIAAAESNWCNGGDPYSNVVDGGADLCYSDYTGVSTQSARDQVDVDRVDLGGGSAQGLIILGQASWYYVTNLQSPDDTGAYNSFYSGLVQLTNNSAVTWYVDGNEGYTVPVGQYDLQTVATHELGHIVGLAHPVNGPNDPLHVMEACINSAEYNHGGSHDVQGEFWTYDSNNSHYGPLVGNVTPTSC